MTLKVNITKEQHGELEETIQALYSQDGDNYKLNVDIPKQDDSELKGLKEKVNELLAEKKKEQEKRTAAEEAAEKERLEKAQKEGDHATLLEAKDKELESMKQDNDKLRKDFDSYVKNQQQKGLEAEALKRASLISSGFNQQILAEQMLKSMSSVDDQIVNIGADGKPTGETQEKFITRFKEDGKYSSLIDATKANGGGATGGSGGGATKPFNQMSADERTELFKKNPALYNKLKNET